MSGKGDPDIKLIQKREANISIGPSTLRGQGPAGTIKGAREFLSQLDLKEFEEIFSEEQFDKRLGENTKKLMGQFPEGAKKNFGAARKALNIFLEHAFYNRFLSEKYNLHKLESFLELPLDNNNAKILRKRAGKNKLPRFRGIKYLESETHEKYQEYAKKLAKSEGIPRIYLDLKFWRS